MWLQNQGATLYADFQLSGWLIYDLEFIFELMQCCAERADQGQLRADQGQVSVVQKEQVMA